MGGALRTLKSCNVAARVSGLKQVRELNKKTGGAAIVPVPQPRAENLIGPFTGETRVDDFHRSVPRLDRWEGRTESLGMLDETDPGTVTSVRTLHAGHSNVT